MNVYRLVVANVRPVDLANLLSICGISGGTVWQGQGFWTNPDVEDERNAVEFEPCAVAEFTADGLSAVTMATRGILVEAGERAAYCTENGARPCLIWDDGHIDPITE